MITRYYIDTSVFGGYFDDEFEDATRQLFEKISKEGIKILYSELTENELENAPEKIKNFIRELKKDSIEYIEISKESIELADKYISENVVGKTSRDDCIHIALATLNRADVLISWNFKHIVNLQRIRGYNAVNLKYNYPTIEIRSPKEMIDYENID
jgi:predicted nucleic acid-binding protein